MSVGLCAEKLRAGDPDRFLSAMTAPPERRGALFALYAFNLEIARAPWVTQEPVIAEMRLQFWRDTVEEIAAGEPPRAHEVAAPLADAVREHGLEARALHAMIDARRWDIGREPFADGAAFNAHLDATAGTLTVLAQQVLGGGAEEPARLAGRAFGLANWLCAVPALEASGRMPLPDGRPDTVRALARDGLARLGQARAMAVPAHARPAFRAGWQAGAILKQAAREPGRVAGGRLGQSDFARRLSLLARTLAGRW